MIDLETGLYAVIGMLGAVLGLPSAPSWAREGAAVLMAGALVLKAKLSRAPKDNEHIAKLQAALMQKDGGS